MYKAITLLLFAAVIILGITVLLISKHIELLERKIKEIDIPEYRCYQCADQFKCPAAHSGVCYPCEHFKNLYTDWGPNDNWKWETEEEEDERNRSDSQR